MSKTKSKTACRYYLASGSCTFGSDCLFRHDKQQTGHTNNSTNAKKKQKKQKKPQNSNQRENKRSLDHIDRFFARYPTFEYDSSRPIWTEFYRMCEFFKWDRHDKEMKDAKQEFKTAMVKQFNDIYGTDPNNLNSWQKLCRVLNMEPVPTDLAACRESVRQTHVNLVDLVETQNTGLPVKVFETLKQLQDYTIPNGKFFPKKSAYQGGLLRFLLREIL
ncbi:uncharacterized protein BKA55DRAFT_586389 [Fusarium redolens]|uniref:C3H1-type domain-containing protein n=1 Tax=Fusarium redolens TaxID=48865 RepID=A0A9P9FYC6_FUSRE|nr:uncharacterized protein BKA55DRAFT_586389 [Fusarium redolens]KAH7207883.1 hypothetical protein BKA55DRAFT_586389 [Fusarium redolens]